MNNSTVASSNLEPICEELTMLILWASQVWMRKLTATQWESFCSWQKNDVIEYQWIKHTEHDWSALLVTSPAAHKTWLDKLAFVSILVTN